LTKAFYEWVNRISDWKKIVQEPLDDLKNISIKNNFSVLILSLLTNENQLNNLINLSAKNKWFFVNAYDFLSKYKEEEIILHPRDDHFNAFGNRLVGENLFKYFSYCIYNKKSSDCYAKDYYPKVPESSEVK